MLENSSLSISKVVTLPPPAGGAAPRRGAPGPDGRIPAITPTRAITHRPEHIAFRHGKPDAQDGAAETRQRKPAAGAQGAGPREYGARVPASVATIVTEPLRGDGGFAGYRDLAHHRDGAAIGSAAYRRAGAEPPDFSEGPALFRLAV